MPKRMFVSIDPGFDSMKIIANGDAFKFPFSVVETDERKMKDYALRDDFMLYKSDVGTTYRVGSYAREKTFEDKSDKQGFYTDERFTSEEFKVGLETSLAISIDKSKLKTVMNELDISLIITLPHGQVDKYLSAVKGAAAGQHNFTLRRGKGDEKQYSFSISESNIYILSQTIAVILGETSDDYGRYSSKTDQYIKEGPTLVLDGGYYTFGMALVSRGGTVDDKQAESDTLHAMKNVNMKVADAIADIRPDIKHHMIEYLISRNSNIIKYIDEDGQAKAIDLLAIKKEKINETCDEFIAYIDDKYNKLIDFNYVLVSGGTGAVYYPRMLEHYKSIGLFDESHFILANTKLYGKVFDIEYSIAVGAYKGLLGLLGETEA